MSLAASSQVPSPYVFIEPAATLADARAAIQNHNPQIALFSGHSFMGSLVFELPDGTVDLPGPADLIEVGFIRWREVS